MTHEELPRPEMLKFFMTKYRASYSNKNENIRERKGWEIVKFGKAETDSFAQEGLN